MISFSINLFNALLDKIILLRYKKKFKNYQSAKEYCEKHTNKSYNNEELNNFRFEKFKNNKDLRVLFSGYQSSLKNQLKKADKNNIDFAVIIGPEEVRSKNFSLKKLKEDEDQLTLEYDQLVKELKNE